MRQDVLDFLLRNKHQFISGQKISEECGITRTAVWKHIQVLRQRGYVIDSYTKRGYCLMEAPELLPPERVRDGLQTRIFGCDVQYFEKVDSTNNVAKKLAESGAKEGTIVLAEEQSGGRGRLSRVWYSPFAKGIWFSLILRPSFMPMEASKMTLLAAVALTKAFHKVGLIESGIKWPNDILVKGRKIVGILTELSASMEHINYVVMGIGINTGLAKRDLPKDLKKISTSFLIENVPVSRQVLFQEVLLQMEQYYELACTSGFDKVLDEWKILSVTLGQDVEVTMPDRVFTGKAIDLNDSGHLLVETETGIETVLAGDVKVRPTVAEPVD